MDSETEQEDTKEQKELKEFFAKERKYMNEMLDEINMTEIEYHKKCDEEGDVFYKKCEKILNTKRVREPIIYKCVYSCFGHCLLEDKCKAEDHDKYRIYCNIINGVCITEDCHSIEHIHNQKNKNIINIPKQDKTLEIMKTRLDDMTSQLELQNKEFYKLLKKQSENTNGILKEMCEEIHKLNKKLKKLAKYNEILID